MKWQNKEITNFLLQAEKAILLKGVTKDLLERDDIITLEEFNKNQIQEFLERNFPNNGEASHDIIKMIKDHNIEDLASLPLLLDSMCKLIKDPDNIQDIFSAKSIVNQATIFEHLVCDWINYDILKKEISKDNLEIRLICSEVLAVEQYVTGDSITQQDLISKCKIAIKKEEGSGTGEEIVEQYVKDARDSTFLSLEYDDSFRFILNPIMEYFVACAIFRHIKKTDIDNLIHAVSTGFIR